jgi:hypothetical protein
MRAFTSRVYGILEAKFTSVIIIFGALILKMVIILLLPDPKNSGPDSVKYVDATLDLVRGGFGANTENLRLFSPGFSLLMYPFYWINSQDSRLVIFFFAIIFALSSFAFVTTLAEKFGNFCANTFALLISFTPIMFETTVSIMYEAPALACLLLLIRILVQSDESGTIRISQGSILLAFLLSFLMVLMHPRYFGFGILIAITFFIWKGRALGIFSLAGVLLAPILGALRNLVATGNFYLAGNNGVTFAVGLNRDWKNNADSLCPTLQATGESYGKLWDQEQLNCSLKLIKEDPFNWFSLFPRKTLEHFEPFLLRFSNEGSFEHVLFTGPTVVQVFWLLLFVGALFFSLKELGRQSDRSFQFLLLTSTGYFWAISLLFFGISRYRILGLPILYLGLSLGISRFIAARKGNQH